MATLYLDLETYSETPIKQGTYRYASDAEIMLLAYAIDEGEVLVEEFPTPARIQALVDDADEVVIQNSMFDRTVLSYSQVRLPVSKVHDTMVRALAHSLPGGLAALCDVLGVPVDKAKDKAGKQLIQLFCKPRPKGHHLRRADKHTHPVEWARFVDYAASDIVATREVYKRLPRWNYRGDEYDLWCIDQTINDRGVCIDVDLAEAALATVAEEQKRLKLRTRELTNDEVQAASQRDAMLKHVLSEYGVDLPDLTKTTLERRIGDPDLPEGLRELLRIRLQAATTSTSKYKALVNGVNEDGRLRGTLQFCGASRTGRWAGRTFQPQNLPRPNMPADEIETGIQAIKDGCADLITGNIMELTSNAIRGCIIAPKGSKLVVADLSNIEGRVLSWLAGEEWKLDAFREFDAGVGPDLYKLGYSRSFAVPIDAVTKDNRQIGKVQELALGYQGAVGAFASMAALYGVVLPEAEVLKIVKAWRRANSEIQSFWYDLEDKARSAILNPGKRFTCRRLVIQRDGAWLRIRLPSGRYLCYPSPAVTDGKITYAGVNQYSRKWERLKTYGGKLVENITQAAARDVIAHGMRLAEERGYAVVLSVHDEVLCETPDTHDFNKDELERILATNPPWSEGLPLAAAGFEGYRYRKD